MVAVKVQSLDDIVRAYFQNLGFDEAAAATAASRLLAGYRDTLDAAADVLEALDGLPVLPDKEMPLDAEQVRALFKLVFRENNGAGRWGVELWLQPKADADLRREMMLYAEALVPAYVPTTMLAQPIESAAPQGWIKKLLSRRKRNAAK